MGQPFLSFSSSRGIITTAALRHSTATLSAAVAGTWLVLLLDRRWKPEPSWIDRAGRLLAVYWLTAGLMLPVLMRSGSDPLSQADTVSARSSLTSIQVIGASRGKSTRPRQAPIRRGWMRPGVCRRPAARSVTWS